MSISDSIVLVESLTETQVDQLSRLFENEWWTAHRELSDIRRLLAGSDHILAFIEPESDRLVAFGRVLTDGVFKAFIFDLIVDEAYRKRGLGEALVKKILTHPALSRVRHFELYCLPELEPFYQRFGFRPRPHGMTLMRRETNGGAD